LEFLGPHLVAQDHDMLGGVAVFLRQEVASEDGMYAKVALLPSRSGCRRSCSAMSWIHIVVMLRR